MVLNRKKLRNRIFKISFSFVISALALVLCLSVRSNAKADTFTYISSRKTNWLSSYNSTISNWNKKTSNISSYSTYTNNELYDFSNQYIFHSENFTMTKFGKTLTIFVPYQCYSSYISDNMFYFPNLITINFGGLLNGVSEVPNDIQFSFNVGSFDSFLDTGNWIPYDTLLAYSGFTSSTPSYLLPNVCFNNGWADTSYSSLDIMNSSFNNSRSQLFNFRVGGAYQYYQTSYIDGLGGNVLSGTNLFKSYMNNDIILFNNSSPFINVSSDFPLSPYGVLFFSISLINYTWSNTSYFSNTFSFNHMPYVDMGFYPLLEENGYQAGFNDGVSSVDTQQYYNNGYDSGYSAGRNSINTESIRQNSYTEGYNAGLLNSSHDYGIKDLLYSIFDVPINVLSNLFSFTIFGSNVWAIIVSLLTILVVLWILSKVLGLVFSGGGKK